MENLVFDSDNIYLARVSKKDGRLISYDNFGRVILIKNQEDVKCGFFKVKSFETRKKCILVEAENVPYDYFDGITDAELQEIFKTCGFELEYQEPIDALNTFYVWCNRALGALITVETWNQNYEDGSKYRGFNSINVTIPTNPNDSFFFSRFHDRLGFYCGSGKTCTYNLVNSKSETPLRSVLSLTGHTKSWNGETPSLWHYGDRENGKEVNFYDALCRIKKFKHDVASEFNMDVEGHLKIYAKGI